VSYQEQLDRMATKHWAKLIWNGLAEDQGTPEMRVPTPDGMETRIIRPRVEPEKTPPWIALPDFETIIRNAFRGRVIDSLTHPVIASLS
jgi:hypothetical protein